jgi:hypothetical protein
MTTNTKRGHQRPHRKAMSASALADQELSADSGARVACQRKAGMLRGNLWVAEDFDAPDWDIEKLFYEGDEP